MLSTLVSPNVTHASTKNLARKMCGGAAPQANASPGATTVLLPVAACLPHRLLDATHSETMSGVTVEEVVDEVPAAAAAPPADDAAKSDSDDDMPELENAEAAAAAAGGDAEVRCLPAPVPAGR